MEGKDLFPDASVLNNLHRVRRGRDVIYPCETRGSSGGRDSVRIVIGSGGGRHA